MAMPQHPIDQDAERRRPTGPRLAARDSLLRRASGFTFIEVLFAIIILGIGSIMLAGMLPVAIKQSSDTRNDLTGRSVAEAGFAYVQAVASSAFYALPNSGAPTPGLVVMPPGLANSPGRLLPLNYSVIENNAAPVATTPVPFPGGPLLSFQSLHGSRVFTSDPRFQWLAFFGRRPDSSLARLVVLSLRLQNVEGTVPATPNPIPIDRYRRETLVNEAINANNGPFLLTAAIREGGTLEPDTIKFLFSDNSGLSPLTLSASQTGPIDSGAFAIVASQAAPANDPQRPYRNNGRVFKLAARRTDIEVAEGSNGLVFDLAPGFDLGPGAPGVDRKFNTADDEVDGSMNPTNTAISPAVNNEFNTGAAVSTGTAVQVWMVGRGLRNPGLAYDASTNPYQGPVQDISVLSVDVPLAK